MFVAFQQQPDLINEIVYIEVQMWHHQHHFAMMVNQLAVKNEIKFINHYAIMYAANQHNIRLTSDSE